MKNKVVLIQPRNTLGMNIYPPLNLIKIGSALRGQGYEVKVITSPIIRKPKETIMKECRDALLVGIGVLTPEVPDAINIAREIKKEYDMPIVWGGWHATLFTEQMAESSLVDHIVVDEGDRLVLEIADSYRQKANQTILAKKIWKSSKKVDLELLPAPDYNLISDIEHYITTPLADKFLEYDKRQVRWLPYEASRGCPSQCAFCINVVTDNQKHRKKSAKKVVREMESMVKVHNINHVKIVDDNYFVDIQWVKEIASGLIDKGLGITWDAECRVNYVNDHHLNDEMMDLCVRSGLNELNFGIESGSQHALDIMKKGITPEQSLHAVKTAATHGVVSRCSFVIDVPGETKEDIYKTVRLINEIRKIPKTTCGVHTYRPYPRSELCEELLRNRVIKQPRSFEEWANEEFISQFTYTDAKRKWQKNHKVSTKVSFYQCLESGFWLRPHQVRNSFISGLNNFFVKIARLRNRFAFYRLCIDQPAYLAFKNLYYKRKQKS
jgi:radical SAM superfamily enzyme YgiQ (UPF0313 family)